MRHRFRSSARPVSGPTEVKGSGGEGNTVRTGTRQVRARGSPPVDGVGRAEPDLNSGLVRPPSPLGYSPRHGELSRLRPGQPGGVQRKACRRRLNIDRLRPPSSGGQFSTVDDKGCMPVWPPLFDPPREAACPPCRGVRIRLLNPQMMPLPHQRTRRGLAPTHGGEAREPRKGVIPWPPSQPKSL